METQRKFNGIALALLCVLLFATSPTLQSAPWESSAQPDSQLSSDQFHHPSQTANELYLGPNVAKRDLYQANLERSHNADYRAPKHVISAMNGSLIHLHTTVSHIPLNAAIRVPQGIPLLLPNSFDHQADIVEVMFQYPARITKDENLQVNTRYQNRQLQTSIQGLGRNNKTNNMDLFSLMAGGLPAMNVQTVTSPASHQQLALAATYRLADTLHLEAGYHYETQDNIAFDHRKLSGTGAFAKLSYRYAPAWSTWLKAETLDSDGNEYDPLSSQPMLTSAWLKESYQAQGSTNQVTLNTDYQTADGLTLSASLYKEDGKLASVNMFPSAGLTQTSSLGYDISAQYSINSVLSVNAYLNQDWYDNPHSAIAQFTPSNWHGEIEDKSTFIAVGISYQHLLDKYLNLGYVDLGIDYRTWNGQGDDGQLYGLTNPYRAPLSRKHNVNVYARYKLAASMSLRFDWLFEKYQNADGQRPSSPWDATPKALPFGEVNHEFNTQYLGLTLSYQM